VKILSGYIQLSATDLSNHVGCAHLTELNRLLEQKKIAGPSWMDPALAVLAKRGDEHEAAYVEYLKSKGLHVAELNGQSVDATLQAMKSGADVIVQARLTNEDAHNKWIGFADILLKVDTPSDLGDWSYEVQDTKLSRNTRGATILQLSLYTELVARLQGREGECMHVVKPALPGSDDPFEVETFRFDEFKAYYRLAKSALEDVIRGTPATTYPDPVEHCNICRWWKECDKKRHDDDHLSLIANIRSMHIGELQKHQINTLAEFASREVPLPSKPDRGSVETYQKIHKQAKIQLKGRTENRLLHELLPLEKDRGFCLLPNPSPGDIYFDIEGDPFFDQMGLEYLFGYAYRDDEGKVVYEKVWARNHVEEKKAFGAFMTFVMDRLKKFKDLHIYHFAPYEPSALKRLSLRHTLHEADLDWLLRAERFVDLHSVAKESIRASVEKYSLKDLERLTPYVREVDLPTAGSARRAVEFALELNELSTLTEDILSTVERYNADDCLATHALHEWLEKQRETLVSQGTDIPRPELKTGEASEGVNELEVRAAAIFRDLTKDLPEDRDRWDDVHKAKWLLANQIDYFRRESKSAWWEFFRLHKMEFDDMLDERKGIAGLEFVADVPITGRQKTPIHRYRYPVQEVGLSEGDTIHEVNGPKIGTIHAISYEDRTVDIKKTGESKDIHPVCIHEEEVVTIEPLATAICDVANAIIEDGMDSLPYRASKDLLMKRAPRLDTPHDGPLLNKGEDVIEGSVRVASRMKFGVVGIQGPPGSGKTHTAAMMILKLAAQGKKIGVTAPSHKVVLNLFVKMQELAARFNLQVRIMHKPKDGEELPIGIEKAKNNKHAIDAVNEGKVVGGTAWLWAHNDARDVLDYLFVDEAGQMSLAHVLAASRSAKNLVLLGDPQQLEQPQKASHPEGADIAALLHLLDGHTTMPDEKGIFLSVTRRLHPNITRFTSEMFYENRLRSLEGLDVQSIQGNTPFVGAGLFYVPVDHHGNQNRSNEEVDTIAAIVRQLTSGDVSKVEEKGVSTVSRDDILIVAPYNAQVAALSEKLPGCRIGTVDKFQGQEAAIVIYSMTSSSQNDAPRGMSFLYNPNRLNVATSRAKCVAILVASEKLLRPECRTIDQMRWANALCRYREMATEVRILPDSITHQVL
jgi:predicted RecB family nuclease